MRILFVDDESAVLSGLQQVMRRQRREWHMEFALGGEVALNLLERETFDIMVTDLKMPIIDGTKLLRYAKANHPSMARVVLSGNTNDDCFQKFLQDSHAILKKPCNPDELKKTLRNLAQGKRDRTAKGKHHDLFFEGSRGDDT